MHRRDAEGAAGQPSGFDSDLAADGIEELLELWIPRTFSYGDFGGSSQTVGLRSTDTDDAWVITVQPDTTVWQRRRTDQAEVIARGTASDLYLFVWNRLGADQLDVSGDRDLLARWQAAATV